MPPHSSLMSSSSRCIMQPVYRQCDHTLQAASRGKRRAARSAGNPARWHSLHICSANHTMLNTATSLPMKGSRKGRP